MSLPPIQHKTIGLKLSSKLQHAIDHFYSAGHTYQPKSHLFPEQSVGIPPEFQASLSLIQQKICMHLHPRV